MFVWDTSSGIISGTELRIGKSFVGISDAKSYSEFILVLLREIDARLKLIPLKLFIGEELDSSYSPDKTHSTLSN